MLVTPSSGQIGSKPQTNTKAQRISILDTIMLVYCCSKFCGFANKIKLCPWLQIIGSKFLLESYGSKRYLALADTAINHAYCMLEVAMNSVLQKSLILNMMEIVQNKTFFVE